MFIFIPEDGDKASQPRRPTTSSDPQSLFFLCCEDKLLRTFVLHYVPYLVTYLKNALNSREFVIIIEIHSNVAYRTFLRIFNISLSAILKRHEA
jgi:hypothetical protein